MGNSKQKKKWIRESEREREKERDRERKIEWKKEWKNERKNERKNEWKTEINKERMKERKKEKEWERMRKCKLNRILRDWSRKRYSDIKEMSNRTLQEVDKAKRKKYAVTSLGNAELWKYTLSSFTKEYYFIFIPSILPFPSDFCQDTYLISSERQLLIIFNLPKNKFSL